MKQIRLENFDNLLESLKELKQEMVRGKEKSKKKEERQQKKGLVMFLIAIFSFFISLYAIYTTYQSDKMNQEVQANNFWLSYLRLAAQKPHLANGLQSIDSIPISKLACRKPKEYRDSTVRKFLEYAWFVANTLGTVEIVLNLTDRDENWNSTLDEIIKDHKAYLGSCCFDKSYYGKDLRARIDSILNKKPK